MRAFLRTRLRVGLRADLRAGGAGGITEESGGGFALEFEEAIDAADFGVGECGQCVQRAGDGDGAEKLLALPFGVVELLDDLLRARAAEDVEHVGDGELEFARDLLDGEGVVEVAGEDEVFRRWKVGGLRLERVWHGASPASLGVVCW